MKNQLLDLAINISNKCGINISKEEISSIYNEPHRYWHTIDHIYDMLVDTENLYKDKKLSEFEYHIFLISILFHDSVYNTRRKDNEEKSRDLMVGLFNPDVNDTTEFKSKHDRELSIVKCSSLIMGTKNHDGLDSLSKKFNNIDSKILTSTFIDMLNWENKIYKEYKWVGWRKYKKNRIKFLLSCLDKHSINASNIKNLVDYIDNKIIKTGFYYYEIDKLKRDITSYDLNSLFDDTKILICCKNGCSKDKIFEFKKIFKYYEFVICNISDIQRFIKKQKGNITIIKDIDGEYDMNIQIFFDKNKIKTIYI